MSTVLRPVGPRPARVYWVRRLVALVAVVVLLGGGWLLLDAVRGDGDAAASESGASGAGAQAAADDDTEDGADDGGDDGRLGACAGEDLTVTLATPVRSYAADETPSFTVAVTNGSEQPCTVDAGSGHLVLTITSGADRIWSSADCAGDQAERLLLLDPSAQHKETVGWERVRSDAECSDGLPDPRPGTYQAVATFHGAETEPAVFELG